MAEARASPSRSRANGRGCKVSQDSCSSTFGRYVRYVLDGFFGKTSRERSQARMGRLSDSSCPKWTSSGTVWRGAYSMRSSSEWPKDAAVSFLSDILEQRLQGFPDDWTKIPYRGKPADECPDGPRYKAIGNSMAVPVMRFIGERIAMAEAGEIA